MLIVYSKYASKMAVENGLIYFSLRRHQNHISSSSKIPTKFDSRVQVRASAERAPHRWTRQNSFSHH